MKLTQWLAALCFSALLFGAVHARDAKKPENEYPNATRAEPKASMSSGEQRDLNKAADLVNESKGAEAEPLVQKVLSGGKAGKYAQAFAHQLLAQIYWDQEKGAQAIEEYKQAVALDALPNNAHFQVMYALAQTQMQEEKYADALVTLEQWEKVTGKQTADELALKGNCYYRLDKHQQAVDTMKKALSMTDKPNDSWNQILMGSLFELGKYDEAAQIMEAQVAKNPTDKKAINQLATIYIQGEKSQKALDLMAKAKSQGLITTSEDYVQLAKMYAAADKPKDAAAVMKEGLGKSTIQPTYENWKLYGDACSQAEDDACAVEAYSKAAPLAKDGNVAYQLGYSQFYRGKSAEALAALDQAITKGGLRQEGEAYLLRGDAKNDLGKSADAIADWQKAAGYPSTKTMAEQRIKAVKGGVKINRPSKAKAAHTK